MESPGRIIDRTTRLLLIVNALLARFKHGLWLYANMKQSQSSEEKKKTCAKMRPTLKTLMCAWRRHAWLQGGSDAPCHSYSGSDNGTSSESWRLYCEEGRAVLGPESRKTDIFAELSEVLRCEAAMPCHWSTSRAAGPVSNDSTQLKLHLTLD